MRLIDAEKLKELYEPYIDFCTVPCAVVVQNIEDQPTYYINEEVSLKMIDVDRYDCDFSLEEQVEALKEHFADLEDECYQCNDKYIKLSDLQKFPIRLNHYDEVNGSLKYVFGVENVIEYAECLPGYYLDNIISELEVLYDLVNENQKLVVSQAIEIVKRNFKETENE